MNYFLFSEASLVSLHELRISSLHVGSTATALAPSLQQWLPEGHLARFIADVTEQLDLPAIYSAYDRRDGRGQAGYHPLLMTRLPLYGYCVGVASSASHRADDL